MAAATPPLAPLEAWSRCLVEARRASEAHCDLLIARAALRGAAHAPPEGGVQGAVAQQAALFAAWTAEKGLDDLLISEYCTPAQALALRACVAALLRGARGVGVAWADAWGFSDHLLNSALGRSDGKVYEALWQNAQLDPANRATVTPAYSKFIEPLVKQRGPPVLPASAALQRPRPRL